MGLFVINLPEDHPLKKLNPYYHRKRLLAWECSRVRSGQELFEIVTVTRKNCVCELSDDIIPKGEKALRIKFYRGGRRTAYFTFKALKQYGAWEKMHKNMKELEKLMGKVEVDQVYDVESHEAKLNELISEIEQLEKE